MWSLVTLGVGGWALSALYQRSVLTALDGELVSAVESLLAGVKAETGQLALPAPPNDARFGRVYSGRYFQVGVLDETATLRPAARSRSLYDAEIAVPARVLADLGQDFGRTAIFAADGPDGQPLRAAAEAVQLAGLAEPVVLIAAADVRPALRDANRFAVTLWLALAALGAGLIAAVFFQVRVGLAPLDAVRQDVAAVRRGRAARLSGDYPLEVAPLTDELNALLDSNRAIVERARTHVGNLAHALKTPISVLRNEAGANEGPLSELVARQTEAMARNVEHYLQRAQAAARAEAVGARCEVGPVLEDVGRTLERLYGRQKDLDLTVETVPGLVFRGERQDLEEMAGNLMENACKYGRGQVLARAVPSGRDAFALIVEDDGPGIESAAAMDVLKRGKRLDESTPGQGLGLAIVDDLARLHGGALELGRSALGGLCATLRLPLTD